VIPIYLRAGDLVVTDQPRWVATVLGSCVAVTLFHRPTGRAAMCHAMLPRPHAHEIIPAGDPQRHRYLSLVIPGMLEVFRLKGIHPATLEVKCFGGANVISLGGAPGGGRWIGSANVEAARGMLRQLHLRPCAEQLGGRRGRKILFDTGTGEVLHKYLPH
jgi:chemotaxis protein CheD